MCSRQDRIQKDVNVVIQHCQKEEECLFSNFRYADAIFTFKYSQGSKRISYSVNVSEDYPDNTCVSNSENADDVLITADPIPVIFQKIAAEMRLKMPRLQMETNGCHKAPEEDDSDRASDSEEVYSDGPEEEDSEGDYGYGGQGESSDDEVQRNPQLEADLQAVRDLYGAQAVSLEQYSGFDDADVDLHVDVSFLDEETANCWSVNRKEPVTIRLNLSQAQYLDGAVPKVDVFQVSLKKDKFGLGPQIKKIMQTFVNQLWGEETTVEMPKRYDFGCLQTASSAEVAKCVPTRHNGFLVQAMEYAEQRLPVLNEFCVICDEPHVFLNGPMLRPYVCEGELCVFAFQTLGVMNKVTDAIATGAQVVDLLLSMARAALASNRRDLIFDPYPSVVDPDNPQVLAFDPKKKDYDRVMSAFKSLPHMQQLSQCPHSELKKSMDTVDKLSLPLLRWVISSNRSHIAKLTSDKQIKFMHTPHQFLLLSSSPAKEAAFRQARNKYGSTFVFHGSNIENWHSIMRKGLVVASNTKYMLHGAAYGTGIYLSPNSSVSFGYSRAHYYGQQNADMDNEAQKGKEEKERFLSNNDLRCIALCEVIKSPCLRNNGQIWVAPKAEYVCTRFFFVYEAGKMRDPNINTQDSKIYNEILNVVNSRHVATKAT